VHQGPGGAAGAEKINQQIQHLCVKDRWRLKVLARGCSTAENKNSGAYDCADTERGQRPRTERFPELVFRPLGFRNKLVNRLTAEKLVRRAAGGFRLHRRRGRWWLCQKFSVSQQFRQRWNLCLNVLPFGLPADHLLDFAL